MRGIKSIVFKTKSGKSRKVSDLSDEELLFLYSKIKRAIIFRITGGLLLVILCIIALILGGKYAW